MRNKIYYLSMVLLTVLGSLTFTACGGDDDPTPEPPVTTLSVTPTDISLMASQGASASFSISASSAWIISCDADWLNLSSRSGNGSTNVTVTAISDNKSATERSAAITITSGDKTQTVNVKQLPAYKNLSVNVTDVVALYNSIAFKLTYTGNVSYFYLGTLSAEAVGWTDNRIVEELQKGTAEKPSDDVNFGIDNLSSNSTYYICIVAFDAQGERGPITKMPVTTKAYTSNRARVSYGSTVSYTSSQWSWTTTIGPYTSRYYMISVSGLFAYVFSDYADALVASIIKDDVDAGDIQPIIQSGSWSRVREIGDSYFYSAAWAKDANNEWAWALDEKYRSLSSSASGADDNDVSTANTVGEENGKPKVVRVNSAEIRKQIQVYAY